MSRTPISSRTAISNARPSVITNSDYSVVMDGTTGDFIATTNAFDMSQDFTLHSEFALDLKSSDAGFTQMIYSQALGTGAGNNTLSISTANELKTSFGGANTTINGFQITDLNYHGFTISYDHSAGVISYYVDGALIGSLTRTASVGAGAINIGASRLDGNQCAGKHDFVVLMTEALDADEIFDLHFKREYPRTNLVAEYLFSEGTGFTLEDTSGNGNTGIINSALVWSTLTRVKQRIQNRDMPYSLDYVSAGDRVVTDDTVDFGESFTAFIWVRLVGGPTGSNRVIVQHANGTGTGRSILRVNTSGELETSLDSGVAEALGYYPMSSNWNRYCLRYDKDASELCLYVNGLLISATASFTATANLAEVVYGTNKSFSLSLGAHMADPIHYGSALTNAQIKAEYYENVQPDGYVYRLPTTEGSGTEDGDSTITGADWITDSPYKARTQCPE